MITFENFDNKNQIVLEPKEIELKIEYGFKQHLIIFDKITMDSYYIDIKNEINNLHLKQINLTFGTNNISSEIITAFNDKNHIIKDVKIEFEVFNLDNSEKNNKIMNINNTIMYIDDIEFNNPGITIYLCGHVVM